ncbi:hypothetical protein DKT77_13065 [Meridianimarinicoccus roseus]|uniref:Magnesium transporter MgtE intracellular domain-containing protein n=1 Tax=Meridianimarinicoccus roseus TaxID=2072018 RepID=A0A2V2LEB1_9RHOB|nr:hypothetical protein DKT77_13065 [Meridianimarinicoccus roseus]
MKSISGRLFGPPSTTAIIATFLIGSAAVRLAGGTAHAIALEVDNLSSPYASYPETDLGQSSAEIDRILNQLQVRSESLDRKETELVQRQEALEDLKAQADQRLQELKNARAALEDMVSVARTAAEKDVSQLVSVYESMKPKEAARVFQQMPPEFAAGFLSRMQPEAAASIVANLEPTTAYSISVVLAGRNVDAAPN